ncbi:MAG: aminoacyl-histidine dipeptidase [Flavobacteriales bacterium]|nr:aminoacyl-histidine dipeptidase [Flavobacteriales bacterium]
MSEVRNLEPEIIWNHFEDLNAVPRPSKKEERVIAFIEDFGSQLGLETYRDPVGNVIIKKPATPGMETRKMVVMQAHLDMVHQKNSDTQFDFNAEGIKSFIDAEWVKADGTTLGADNGMGVAAIMAVLSSNDLEHPAIEALFTIDEETGMTGAFELEKGVLKGKILLNLDTEDDDEFSIGCAGGIDTNTLYKYIETSPVAEAIGFEISITGLKGGHSGMDIHLGRGNANILMNRLLLNTDEYGLRVAEINGGSLRNAIPRESFATIVIIGEGYLEAFKNRARIIKSEFSVVEAGLNIEIKPCALPISVMTLNDQVKMTNAINCVYNGVYRMSAAIEGLVETSSSLARVIVKKGEFTTQSLQRSSVESSKMDIAYTVGSAFKLMGCEVEHSGSYPGWAPNPDSEILHLMVDKYSRLFNEKPRVQACHAGLECGILGQKYPEWDMISFGPTIRNPHSPDEKVNIKSVQKFWGFLKDVLKDIPAE